MRYKLPFFRAYLCWRPRKYSPENVGRSVSYSTPLCFLYIDLHLTFAESGFRFTDGDFVALSTTHCEGLDRINYNKSKNYDILFFYNRSS